MNTNADTPKRYAKVVGARDATQLRAYLPDNYVILYDLEGDDGRPLFVIEGKDVAGWTLDRYVLPRLGSGLIFGEEIDLSHPLLRKPEYLLTDLQACAVEDLPLSTPEGITVYVHDGVDMMGMDRVDVRGPSREAIIDYVREHWGDDDDQWFAEYVVGRVAHA